MPAGASSANDLDVSQTYHSYERDQEQEILLSDQNVLFGQKPLTFSSKSTKKKHAEESVSEAVVLVAPRSRCIVLMIACMYLHFSCAAVLASLGVIYVELISSLGSSRSDAALVQSMYIGLALCAGVLSTKLITKYDTGICVMCASVVGCLAFIGGSYATNIATVITLVGVIGGLATSVNIISAQVVINWTFVSRRKFALSVFTIGATVGQMTMPYVADALVKRYYWDGCLFILSALGLLNCFVSGLVIYYSRQYFHRADESKSKGSLGQIMSFFTDSAFILYIVAMFIYTALGTVEQWFSVDIAVLRGFGAQAGASLLSINGIFGLVGRVAISIFLQFYPDTRPELHMCYSYFLWAVVHIAIIESPVYWGMALSMALRGITSGVAVALSPSLLIELLGPEQFAPGLGLTYMVNGVSQILGGPLAGLSADVTGSYNLIFYIAAGAFVYMACSMIAIHLILKRRQRMNLYQRIS